jgi:CheY-like chemotaxis protein
MLAHELRNPLAPILSAVEIMRLERDNPDLIERMRDLIERQARGLARLVDDLLDVSRITRGKIQLRLETVELDAVINRAAETTGPMLQRREQTLHVTLSERPIYLWGDPMRLEQIVVNLLNNASKYSDSQDAISLETYRDGEAAVIRVRDRGIGISPEMAPYVFELFSQADHSLDRSQGGLGIGLTLVRSLARLHGGSVECHSDGPGQGSEFTVRLPILKHDGALKPKLEGSKVNCSPIKRRVLIVDDNVQAAESLSIIVGLWGHETRMAYRGIEAIEFAADFRPEAVLLDIGLPGIDGCEVARRLRATPGLHDVLLIAITGYGRDEDRERTKQAGFDRHFIKPLDLDGLERLLASPRPRAAT